MIAQLDLSKSQLLEALLQIRKGSDRLRQQHDDRQRDFLGKSLHVAEQLVQICLGSRRRFSFPLLLRADESSFKFVAFLFQPFEDRNVFRRVGNLAEFFTGEYAPKHLLHAVEDDVGTRPGGKMALLSRVLIDFGDKLLPDQNRQFGLAVLELVLLEFVLVLLQPGNGFDVSD